jgi:glycosyltransferase involved in cell wall biosynthesis
MSVLRIVCVITGLGSGGAEVMLLRLLRHIDRRRFAPHVISLTGKGEVGERIAELGIPVECLAIGQGSSLACGWWRLVRRIAALEPDVVHTWMYHADLVGGTAARAAGVRSVVWGVHHSNLSPQLNKRATLVVARLCAHLSRWVPARITCCSQVARDVHRAFGYASDKLVFIPNGFELDLFRPDPVARRRIRNELQVSPGTQLVGMVGRFDPQKNHAGFIRAASLLHRRLPDVHFVLAGSGIDAANDVLRPRIAEAGIELVTHLLGPRNDIANVMASLDVLVSSSDGEAFPNVLGEAMACEVPCAVTDVGDSALIVGGAGRVVAAGDMDALAQATRDLLLMGGDGRAQLGRDARERVRSLYSIERVVQQYESLYESVVVSKVTKCAA